MTGTALAVALGSAGLVAVGTPAAYAATASDEVVKLPISSYSAMAVDSVHERVYVSDNNRGTWSNTGVIAVYDFQGHLVSRQTTETRVSGLALSADGNTLYTGERARIVTYDATTLKPTVVTSTYEETCGREVAVTGDKAWWTTQSATYVSDCPETRSDLDGLVGGAHSRTNWNAKGRLQLEAAPDGAKRLFMGQENSTAEPDPFLASFDTEGDNPVRDAVRRFGDSEGKGALQLKDVAVSADGKRVAVADAAYGTRLLNAGDLSDAGTPYQALPEGARSSAVAFSGDGKYVARGAASAGSTADLLVQPADPADGVTPFEFAFEGPLDGSRVVPRGLDWSKDGKRLFAVTTSAAGGEYWMHIIQPPAAQYDSRFTGALTTTPSKPVVGEPLGIRGKLELDGPAPTEPVKVAAVRKDADGTQEVAAAKVAADGSFTVLDVPDRLGGATYTLRFLGDVTHRPAEDVTVTVDVAKAATAIELTAPAEASRAGGVEITGSLTGQGRALPSGTELKVTRTDRLGTTGELTAARVAADGTFKVKDLPGRKGRTVYAVSYEGDALHEGSSARATVRITG
ncbi:Ig-like domain repeat protein [Streptomyces sp. NPDC058308]|uniref:Ig-like domain repeat protein n=1 Tax=Streptomyces sp. NPDC058308 TaxID=3346440 RepID=UPI0036EB6CC4